MERHRSLYKENSSMLSPRQHKRLNRELQQGNRVKQRDTLYLSTRNIIVSPTPRQEKPIVPISATSTPAVSTAKKPANHLVFATATATALAMDNKENIEIVTQNADNKSIYSSRIAKVTSAANAGSLSRPEAFLLRFIEWKEAKKQQEALEKEAKAKRGKPFVSSGIISGNGTKNVIGTTVAAATTISFVPKNHKFKAPEGLKNPATAEPLTDSSNAKLRRSLYTVVPTPPKKKLPIMRNALATGLEVGATSSRKLALPYITTSAAAIKCKPKATSACDVKFNTEHTVNVAASAHSGTAKKKARLTNLRGTPGCFQNTTERIPKLFNKPAASKAVAKAAASATVGTVPSRQLVKPPQFKLLSACTARPLSAAPTAAKTVPSRPVTRIVKPRGAGGVGKAKSAITATVGSGAIGKVKILQHKRANIAPNAGSQPMQKANKLSVNMKAKRPVSATAAAVKSVLAGQFKLSGRTLLNIPRGEIDPLLVAETPTDGPNTNPFEAFVTSTKQKISSTSLSQADELSTLCDTISPVEALSVQHESQSCPAASVGSKRVSSAKRVLMREIGKQQQKTKYANTQEVERKRKFNFIRYSVGNITANEDPNTVLPTANDVEESEPVTVVNNDEAAPSKQPQTNNAVTAVNSEETSPLQHTPSKETNGEPPVNYLSPFVSVSRGKVNSRKEQENRNSIYVPVVSIDATDAAEGAASKPDTPLLSVEARRTLETVRYFRRQLADEITRLHTFCDQWETYKAEHLPRLQETSGEDMINVTIGQTKLLTSKKFMQFSGLIDRCEASVTGVGSVVDDGSEKTKPITSVDLEGFWSMVGLQVENVDKRFANLQRWKVNDWVDPDEVSREVRTMKHLNKVKKTKTNNNVASNAANKAKPSSVLQQMLRQMHADMRKKNSAATGGCSGNGVVSEDVILTPTSRHKKRHSKSGTPTTPGRISVIVKDRKSRSAAATVVSIPTPTRRLSSLGPHKKTLDSSQLSPYVQKLKQSLARLQSACNSSELLKTALITASNNPNENKRHKSQTQTKMVTPPCTPGHTRKSILKTPGTAKGKPKNVVFNEKLRIKKFKFTVEDEAESEEEQPPAVDTDERTYGLRTRKVILRPSSEFTIPK